MGLNEICVGFTSPTSAVAAEVNIVVTLAGSWFSMWYLLTTSQALVSASVFGTVGPLAMNSSGSPMTSDSTSDTVLVGSQAKPSLPPVSGFKNPNSNLKRISKV